MVTYLTEITGSTLGPSVTTFGHIYVLILVLASTASCNIYFFIRYKPTLSYAGNLLLSPSVHVLRFTTEDALLPSDSVTEARQFSLLDLFNRVMGTPAACSADK